MFNDRKKFIEYLLLFFSGLILSALIIIKFDHLAWYVEKFFGVLRPFYIGFAIAYILDRPVGFFEKKFKSKRGLSVLVVYLGLIGILITFGVLILPSVIDSSVKLVNELSRGVADLPNTFNFIDNPELQSALKSNLNRLTELMGSFTNFLVENVTKLFMSVTSTLLNVIFGIIISIYMLIDKEKIRTLFSNIVKILFNKENSKRIHHFLEDVNTIFGHFITGLIIEALIVGVLAFIGMTILKVRYAPVLAVIICFTNVIPYIGPFIGAVPAVAATMMYDPTLAIWVLVFIAILQQIDGNFIGPKVMGNYIGLDPIWIILSITIGGGFLGMLGIMLAIPTGAIIKIILTHLLDKKVAKKAL